MHPRDEEDNGIDEKLLPIFVGPCSVDEPCCPRTKTIPSTWWKDVMDTHRNYYYGDGSPSAGGSHHNHHNGGHGDVSTQQQQQHPNHRKAVLFSYSEGVYFTFTKQVNYPRMLCVILKSI